MTQPPVTGAHDFGITIPDRIHPQADAIGERLAEWAERTGLAATEVFGLG